jgi:pSer/pThr/pTyr-binding forkhead associated (FHA) protein
MTTLELTPHAVAEAPTERLEHTSDSTPKLPHPPIRDLPPGRHLLVRRGDETEVVTLTAEVTHLGRGLTADVRLDDHLVSRRHAIIVVTGSRTRLINDRSANGVALNGRSVQDADLYDGDVIVLGRSVLRYLEC